MTVGYWYAVMDGPIVRGARAMTGPADPVPVTWIEIAETIYDQILSSETGGVIVNGAYVPPVTSEIRVTPDRFMDLFLDAELDAIFDLVAAGNKPARRMWERAKLTSINLLSPRVLLGLQYLATQSVFGAAASARIAAIRANQTP